MAISVTVVDFHKDADGSYHVLWSDGIEQIYDSLSALKSAVQANLTIDDVKSVALKRALTIQPNLNNPAAFNGHFVSIDFTLAAWGNSG